MFNRLRPLIDRIALRLGYVPAVQLSTLREAAKEMVKHHNEYHQAANAAIAALLYNQDNRAKIDETNRRKGMVDAQIIRLEDHRS